MTIYDLIHRREARDEERKKQTLRCGILFQRGGVWIGVHYSKENRRFCINLIPCFTIWVCLPGGRTPRR